MRAFDGLLTRTLLRRTIGLVTVLAIGAVLVAYTQDHLNGETIPRSLTTDRTRIVRPVDGDTLIVRAAGRQERVRVLGIDTPETVKPGAAVQRCGPEASKSADRWAAAHRVVFLIRDPASPNRDRFGRLLRYVQPEDGTADLSTFQVEAGLAHVRSYGEDLSKLPPLEAAQRRARSLRVGLWGGECAAP